MFPSQLKTNTIVFAILCLCCCFVQRVHSEKIVGVVFFHRHGDRTPYMMFPNDLNNQKWTLGKGKLTPTGMAQEHKLGSALRDRYVTKFGFLSPEYNATEYYVRSTDVDRTLQSAQSLLSGLFPLGSGPEIYKAGTKVPALPSRQQVIPIHTVAESEDELLLSYNSVSCPNYGVEFQNMLKSDEAQAMARNYSDTFREAETIAGYETGTVGLSTVNLYTDSLKCELAHNMNWIRGFAANPELYTRGLEVYNWVLTKRFESKTLKFLGAGEMLSQVIYRLQRSANEPTTVQPEEAVSRNHGLKMSEFSAHDTTVAGILSAVDAFDGVNPPYSSSAVFEAFREQDGGPVKVRLFYNSGVGAIFKNDPVELKCCGYPRKLRNTQGHARCSSCLLSDFANHYGQLLDQSHHAACGKGQKDHYLYVIMGSIIALLAAFSAFSAYRLCNYRSDYSPIE